MGFIKIENSLLEAMVKAGFSGTEYCVLFCLIRFTNGFNRESCDASAKFISDFTGGSCSVSSVRKALARLIARKVIAPTYRSGSPTSWKINPPEMWAQTLSKNGQTTQKRSTQKRADTLSKNGQGGYPKMGREGTQIWVPRKTILKTILKTEEKDSARARAREPERSASAPSAPPTKSELFRYASDNGLRYVNVDRFFDYYTGTGWTSANGNPINWRRKLKDWDEDDRKKAGGVPSRPADPPTYDPEGWPDPWDVLDDLLDDPEEQERKIRERGDILTG